MSRSQRTFFTLRVLHARFCCRIQCTYSVTYFFPLVGEYAHVLCVYIHILTPLCVQLSLFCGFSNRVLNAAHYESSCWFLVWSRAGLRLLVWLRDFLDCHYYHRSDFGSLWDCTLLCFPPHLSFSLRSALNVISKFMYLSFPLSLSVCLVLSAAFFLHLLYNNKYSMVVLVLNTVLCCACCTCVTTSAALCKYISWTKEVQLEIWLQIRTKGITCKWAVLINFFTARKSEFFKSNKKLCTQ